MTNYESGIVAGVELVKRIYELDVDTRISKFGTYNVPAIIDEMSIEDIQRILDGKNLIEKQYVVRIIRRNGTNKNQVVAESKTFHEYPSKECIFKYLNDFDKTHFAVVQELYVKE